MKFIQKKLLNILSHIIRYVAISPLFKPLDHLFFFCFVSCTHNLLPVLIAQGCHLACPSVRVIDFSFGNFHEYIICQLKCSLNISPLDQRRDIFIQNSFQRAAVIICVPIVYKTASVRIAPADFIDLSLQVRQKRRICIPILQHQSVMQRLIIVSQRYDQLTQLLLRDIRHELLQTADPLIAHITRILRPGF